MTEVNLNDARRAFDALVRGENCEFEDFWVRGAEMGAHGHWFLGFNDRGELHAWVDTNREHEVAALRLVVDLLDIEAPPEPAVGYSMVECTIAGPLTVTAYRATLDTTVEK